MKMTVTPLADIIATIYDTNSILTIRLYGRLGAKFGRVHRMAVKTAGEAVRALGSQLRGFEAYMTASQDRGEGYAVFYGRFNLGKEDIHAPNGGQDIRIAPILLGAKNGGWLQIILGAVLIAVSFLTFWTGPVAAGLFSAGLGLVIGGVLQLLTPVPKGLASQDSPENRPNYSFNGAINTQAQGHPVPVLYGELIVGSAVISAGISATDDVYVPRYGTPLGSGGGGGGGGSPWHLEWFGTSPVVLP